MIGCGSAPLIEPVRAQTVVAWPSMAVTAAAPMPAPPAVLEGAKTLTNTGENTEGQYAPDGKKILFLSNNRAAHLQMQVYEKDLATGRERRVTFQDGDTSSPRYDFHAPRLYYASTTDELKENPLFLQKQFTQTSAAREPGSVGQKADLMPTDIYVSGLDGDNIQRLTNVRGFDGAIAIHPKTDAVYFSSYRTSHLQLYWMDAHTHLTHIFSRDPLSNQVEMAISPDGRNYAWVQYADDFKSSQIVIGNARGEVAQTLTQGDFLHINPAWAPNNEDLVFASNQDGKGDFDLYVNNKGGTCLRRLTKGPAMAQHPAISPDGKQLLLTSKASGSSQLYAMTYQPTAACAELQKAAK